MSAYPCPHEHHESDRVDSAANRSLGEMVSLADRRYENLVAAAMDFLDRARSFGWSPPPFPAPPEVRFKGRASKAARDERSASATSAR